MELRIFPYTIVRYASMRFRELECLHMPGWESHITETDILNKQLSESREALCDCLFTAIKAQEDDKRRQQLLQLKRAVYNDRLPDAVSPIIDPVQDRPLYALLQTHQQLMSESNRLHQEWEQAFSRQLIRHRQQLQAWAGEELLRAGILLSSPVLYTQLDSFAAADPAAFRNRELKNEYSLLRYITRMACKTSPFSTFTYSGTAVFDEAEAGISSPVNGISSSIRLNNSLFAYIRSLMIHHPALNGILELKLNATTALNGEQLRFLINYFNVEAFQQLPARNLPLWLFHFLREQEAPLTLETLTDILAGHIPDTDRESIRSFLLKLVSSGFLEPDIGCSGVDPAWDKALTGFLERRLHSHPAIAPLHELLQLLGARKEAYAKAPVAERYLLLQQTAGALNQQLGALQAAAGLPVATAENHEASVVTPVPDAPSFFEANRFMPRYFSASDIFYEDAYTKSSATLPAAAVNGLTEKVERLCSWLEPADGLQEERERMRDFFLQHYGAAHEENITAFYHAYYLHVKKPEKEQRQEQGGRASKAADDRLLQRLAGLLEEAELTTNALQVNIDVTTGITAPTARARGMFVQYYYERQNEQQVLHGVINALLPGMGKVAGRFLHLFDEQVGRAFREWNTLLYPAHMLMELNDGSAFNANIHPPLLPYEICMPGGNNNYPAHGQVGLNAVMVRYNAQRDLLSLYHAADGREVYAYDLCLESFYNRSNFYQLLAHFNPEPRLPLRKFITAVDHQHEKKYPQQGDVRIKPRITFSSQVVLRRKGWLLRTAAIPVPQKDEHDGAYFVRLNQWRLQQQVPEHVFLFLRSPYMTAAPRDKSRLQRDDYKPQYICFTQPLLVNLLRKLLSRADEHCYMEEMLPYAGTAETVTEYMMHWYKY